MTTANLGPVKAIHTGTSAPQNTDMIWRDTSVSPQVHKSYNTVSEEWSSLNENGIFSFGLEGRIDHVIASGFTGSGSVFWSSYASAINSAIASSTFGQSIQAALDNGSYEILSLSFDLFIIVALSGTAPGYGMTSIRVQGPLMPKNTGFLNQPSSQHLFFSEGAGTLPSMSHQSVYQRVNMANPNSLPSIYPLIKILNYDLGSHVQIDSVTLTMYNIVLVTKNN